MFYCAAQLGISFSPALASVLFSVVGRPMPKLHFACSIDSFDICSCRVHNTRVHSPPPHPPFAFCAMQATAPSRMPEPAARKPSLGSSREFGTPREEREKGRRAEPPAVLERAKSAEEPILHSPNHRHSTTDEGQNIVSNSSNAVARGGGGGGVGGYPKKNNANALRRHASADADPSYYARFAPANPSAGPIITNQYPPPSPRRFPPGVSAADPSNPNYPPPSPRIRAQLPAARPSADSPAQSPRTKLRASAASQPSPQPSPSSKLRESRTGRYGNRTGACDLCPPPLSPQISVCFPRVFFSARKLWFCAFRFETLLLAPCLALGISNAVCGDHPHTAATPPPPHTAT